MSKSSSTSKVKLYLQNHWLKIGIAAVLILVLMKKDLSFSVDLNAPNSLPSKEKSVSPPVKAKGEKREILSEKQSTEEESPITKLFVAPLNNLLGENKERSDKFWLLDEDLKVNFINRFTHVAENEQLKYGVPASVILACGLLMSEAGNSELARQGNNYFGLPCTADWMGNEGYHESKCYRYYENAWTSFRDNSLYLTTYLFPGKQLPANNHRGWIAALEQVKFADEPNLSAQLLKIIDHYDLQELDK